MDGTDARALLCVPTHATTDQIRRAFRGAAFDAHPDQGGDPARFRRLMEARDTLLATATPTRRTHVDRFTMATRAMPHSAFSVTDIVARPAVVPTVEQAPRSFEQVLADVLAA